MTSQSTFVCIEAPHMHAANARRIDDQEKSRFRRESSRRTLPWITTFRSDIIN